MKIFSYLLTLSLTLGSFLGIAQEKTKKFDFTGKEQKFVVPKGCTSIEVEMVAGSGGWSIWEGKKYDYYIPGKGGKLKAVYPVTPGETIYIYVGGKGSDAYGDVPGEGGFNGGGNGNTSEPGYGPYTGGGGGGASDIRVGGNSLENRVLVVGGAGGAGSNYPDTGGDNGGHGGELKGTDGQSNSTDHESVGRGGSQREGGEGGLWSGYTRAENGSLGQGGNAPDSTSGGGGGGGYYGGGAGCWSGGGGGSSFTASGATKVRHQQGVHEGDGYVIIKYTGKEDTDAPRDCSDFTVTATTANMVICEGETLALYGNGADKYTWSDGIQDTKPFKPTAGIHTYKVEGKSSDGVCSGSDEITVIVNKLDLTTTVNYNEVSGLGIVDIEVGGNAVAPFKYEWEGSDSYVGHFDELTSGNYSLIVTDALGCKATTSVNINQKEPLDLNPVNNSNYALTATTNEDQSFVTISYKGAFEFQIVDKDDRIVKNGNAVESTQVDISRLKPGKYTVQLIYKEVKEEVSFVKR